MARTADHSRVRFGGLVTIVFCLAACGGDGETVVETSSGPAPVSHEMVAALERLSELMLPTDFDVLQDAQAVWLERREQYCAASIEAVVDAQDVEATLAECRASLDTGRMQELRRKHLPLLLEAERPRPRRSAEPPDAREIPAAQHVMSMQLDPVGEALVTGSAPNVTVSDFDGGETRFSFDAHPRAVSRIAVSPNGKLIVTGSRHESLLKLWDAERGMLLFEIDVEFNDAGFAFLPDGKHLLIGTKRLKHLDLTSGYLREVTFASGTASAFAINDTYVAVGTRSSEIQLFTPRHRGGFLEFKPQARGTAAVTRNVVVGMSFSDDGRYLVSVTRSGVIEKWLVPEMAKIQSSQSELAFVAAMAATSGNENLYLSGNTAERGNNKGKVLAVDLDSSIAKRLYEDASTNAPLIELNEAAGTLVVADGRKISYLPVPTDRSGFETMQSLGMQALADFKSDHPLLNVRAAARRTSSLPDIADEATVHAVGVYQGALGDGQTRGFQQQIPGQVTVNVGGAGRVILVLTAYEPVKWNIRTRGAVVDKVLLFGYHDQKVVSAHPGTRVYSNLQASTDTSRIYAYKMDKNYHRLARAVAEITGKNIETFQGKYEAASFSLNVSPGLGMPAESSGIHKWVDEDGVVHYGDSRTARPKTN